jgi:hypothetical protein
MGTGGYQRTIGSGRHQGGRPRPEPMMRPDNSPEELSKILDTVQV